MLQNLNVIPTFLNEFPENSKEEAKVRFPALTCLHVGWAAHLPPKWPALHLHEATRHILAYVLRYSNRRPQSLHLQMLL